MMVIPVVNDAELASVRNWHAQKGVRVVLDLQRAQLSMDSYFSWQTYQLPGYLMWPLPVVPRADAANSILDELVPLAERVLAGDETAAQEIEEHLAAVDLTEDQQAFSWDVFYDGPIVPEVTADMTDQDLRDMIRSCTASAKAAINTIGWFELLVSERDHARLQGGE